MSNSQGVKTWRKATKERMVAAMGGKCQCCGYDRCVEALDFHHINPAEKEMSLGAIRGNPRAWPVIVNELRKCILVCSNCHDEIHYGHRVLPTEYARFDARYLEYKTHPDLADECPVCGGVKYRGNQTCSRTCAGAKSHIDWSPYDLAELAKTHSLYQIADMVGCSRGAVSKRLDKLGIPYIKKTPVKMERSFVPFVYEKPIKEKKPKPSEVDPNWRQRANLKRRKVDRPSSDDLSRMVWEKPLTDLGKDFGVTGNNVKKWCKSYGIEWPPRGYWRRRECGYSHEESLISHKRELKGKRFITDDVAQEAIRLRQEGLSYRVIGERLGFGHWSIQQGIERYLTKVAARVGTAPTDDKR